jgi:ATP-dependent helicase HepA
MEVVFTDLHGGEVADAALLQVLSQPFRRVREGGTDTNLTKHRLAVLQHLVDRDAWAGVCGAARTASERSLRERPEFAEDCGRLASAAARELAARVRVLERRFQRGEGDRAATGRELALERELAEALCKGIGRPELRLDAVGFIVISGREPHEEDA